MSVVNGECDLTYIGFNQNFSSLAVGSNNGFKVFRVKSCDELEIDREFDWKDVCIFERFFETFMAALVTRQHPKNVVLYNIYENNEICYFKASDDILSARLNSKRLLICCRSALHIYDLGAMKELHVIRDTPSNPTGITALSPRDVCYMAYPGSALEGIVHVFDADNLKAVSIISAHNLTVAAMTFNSQGTLLATASRRGTVIRIFSPETSEKLTEFRRGSLTASIYSLSFSLDSTYLACSSNSRTVHIFRLKDDENNHREKSDESQVDSGWWRYIGGVIQNSAMMLQSSANYIAGDRFIPLRRSFAVTYLPSAHVRNTCAFVMNSKFRVLLVATVDGYLYTYAIDAINGGECTLLKQQRFSDVECSASSKTQHSDPSSTSIKAEEIAFNRRSMVDLPSIQKRPVFIADLDSTVETMHPEISNTKDETSENCTVLDELENFPSNSELSCYRSDSSKATSDANLARTESEIETRLRKDGATAVATTPAAQAETALPAGTTGIGSVVVRTENVVTNHDVDLSLKCKLKPICCSFTLLGDIASCEKPDPSNARTEDGCLVYGPVPKQTYASVVVNRRQGDSPEERKAEAEAALRDAVEGDGKETRKI